MATVIYADFEWEYAKAMSNLAKHGVSFEEAATALVDPNAVFFSDDAAAEQRFIAIGLSLRHRLLFVVHIERGERDRIISARVATRSEEDLYAQAT